VLLLLDESESVTPLLRPCTTLGPPRPRYGPTCSHVRLATPDRSSDASPLSSLQPLPMAHVLVQHQCHLISASLPPSSLHVKVALVPGEPEPRPSMPLSLRVPHLQENTKYSVNIHKHLYNQMLAIKTTKHNTKTYLSSQSSHGGIVLSGSCR
jgi:hypothetical protein